MSGGLRILDDVCPELAPFLRDTILERSRRLESKTPAIADVLLARWPLDCRAVDRRAARSFAQPRAATPCLGEIG